MHRVVSRVAGNVVPLRPNSGPKLEIGGKHYALSTDSGPLMGDLAEDFTPSEGGARIIHPPENANKWRYLWAYDTDAQVLAMWRVSDGDEKVWENAKHAGAQIVKLSKKGQLNRVGNAEFKHIESHMQKRNHETIESLKKIVEDNKHAEEKQLDVLVREYFEEHVVNLIEHSISNIKRGVTPIGFKAYDHKGEVVSVERQATIYVVSSVIKKEMTIEKVEAFLRSKGFDLDSVHNQSIEWAIGDVQDAAMEKYLPPR